MDRQEGLEIRFGVDVCSGFWVLGLGFWSLRLRLWLCWLCWFCAGCCGAFDAVMDAGARCKLRADARKRGAAAGVFSPAVVLKGLYVAIAGMSRLSCLSPTSRCGMHGGKDDGWF